MRSLFKGWYFKHQNQTQTFSIIVGYCIDHAFIQIITDQESRNFCFKKIKMKHHSILIGDCIFSKKGITLHLPNINGSISYGPLQSLSSDIMGPFRFFPMECRHNVISMNHSISGSIDYNNTTYVFDHGKGYIEGDFGKSFPSSYLWLQSNDFQTTCSIMLSIAKIPFYGLHFTGCICAITFHGKEYRFATYNGVQIHVANQKHICLSQKNMLLEIDIDSNSEGYPLRSPKAGNMSNTIYESCDTAIQLRLWNRNKNILHEKTKRASFECLFRKDS